MTTALAPFQQPGVTFDDREHRYFFHGERVLNVTSIMREHKISADWSVVPAQTLIEKREIGRAAHLAAHYFDEGDLVLGSVAPEVTPYLDAWRRFVEENDVVMLLLETLLVHPLMRYGGTVDRFASVRRLHPSGRPSIVDIKTGDPHDAGAGPQTAAYEQLIRAVFSPDVFGPDVPSDLWDEAWTRYSVQLLPDGRYKLKTYTSHRDLQRFNWALSLEASCHSSWRRP
jgi:hypothetical protein